MKIKNPVRTYLNWYGKNLCEIAAEPAGKALVHYGKFTGKVIVASVAVSAVLYGGVYLGMKIYDRITEDKE